MNKEQKIKKIKVLHNRISGSRIFNYNFDTFFIGYDKKIAQVNNLNSDSIILKGIGEVNFDRLTDNSLDLVIKKLDDYWQQCLKECW